MGRDKLRQPASQVEGVCFIGYVLEAMGKAFTGTVRGPVFLFYED